MSSKNKPLVWLKNEVKTPPFSASARVETGYLLRLLQQGDKLSLPHSRLMPTIGARCYELRVVDGEKNWRVVYRVDTDAIIILDVFQKKTQATPKNVIDNCKRRIKQYDS
jgi:phage-related protein